MKYTKTILIVMLAVLLCVNILAIPAHAAEVTGDGLKVTLTTDQEAYTKAQTVTATLMVTNTNGYGMENVDLNVLIPEGYEVSDGAQNELKQAQLSAGQTVTLTVVMNPKTEAAEATTAPTEATAAPTEATAAPTEATAAPTEATAAPTEATTAPTEATAAPTEATAAPTEATTAPTESTIAPADNRPAAASPSTGDTVGIWVVLMVTSLAGMVILFLKKRKQAIKMMSLLLCLSMIGAVAVPAAKADSAEPNRIEVETAVQIEGEAAVIKGVVTYLPAAQESTPEEDPESDSDADGISLALEEFLGSDPNKADTDGDGLTDDKEVLIGTSPIQADTDGDGIPDGDEDADGDGLTNLTELELGTSPVEDDTDHDGLTDAEEVTRVETVSQGVQNTQSQTGEGDIEAAEESVSEEPKYSLAGEGQTQALNADTDGDGALDGWEKDHGYDPLTADEVFEVSEETVTDSLRAQVTADLSAEQINTIAVEEVVSSELLNETIAGYMGSPVKLNIDGSFENAKITFTFDETQLTDGTENPTIYRFDKDTQLLEEVTTTVTGNVAYATVSESSVYILLDKNKFEETWAAEIMAPIAPGQSIDVVFAVDCSNSMNYYKRLKVAKAALNTFIDALDEADRAALVSYNTEATTVSALTADKAAVKAQVDALVGAGSTATYTGFESAIAVLSNEDETYGYKMIILLSDGTEPSSHYEEHYNALVEQAVAAGIVVHTIGAGDTVDSALLTQIAQTTGGHYYNATISDEIDDALDDIVDQTIDSNNDGITDYYTKQLCDGTLKLGTGKDNPFANLSFKDIQVDTDGDYDNDGLLNGEELIITQDETEGLVYAKMNSDPTLVDTDYDGIDDPKEMQGYAVENLFYADAHHNLMGSADAFGVILTMDYRMFFEDNTQYNKDLAVLASLYAHDMYIDNYIDMTYGTTGYTKDINGVLFGEIFGLSDCVNIDSTAIATTYAKPDSNGNPVDQDDISEVFIGHRLVNYNGEDREIFVMSVRGTNGTHEEWTSNFDIGTDSSEYYDITGEHPDWLNKANHKGFDVAANRVLTAFHAYVADLEAKGALNTEAKRSIFISGHSRGAAIANLLGAAFEDMEGYDSYTYTMASPYSTTNENANTYKTIFNIMNTDDLVAYLPLDSWGFYKYGQTLQMSIEQNYEDQNTFGDEEHTFENVFGQDYNSNSYVNSAVEAFGKMTNGRSDFYILDTTSGDGRVMEGAVNFGDTIDNLIKLLKTGKMYRFCEIEKVDLWVGYNIYVTNSPAYVAQNIANLASCGDIEKRYGYPVMEWIGIDLKGKYSTARQQFALASGQIAVGGVGPGGMECPHMPGSYYLIAYGTPYDGYVK